MKDRKNRYNESGFTLAELLIVVAIIGVLVAVAVLLFSKQLEKSREATDLANVRAAYAEVMSAAITEDKDVEYNGEKIYDNGVYSANIALKQKQNDWQSYPVTIADVTVTKDTPENEHWKGFPGPDGTCTVSYKDDTGIIFNWDGGTASGGSTVEYNNDILSAFKSVVLGQSTTSFIVANSTYNKNDNTSITKINEELQKIGSNIKTWAILSTKRNSGIAHNKEENKNYLFSEVDISEHDNWKAGDKIPAILQKENGKIQVGMASLYEQNDGAQGRPYYVISRDEKGRTNYSSDDFDMDSVIRDDGKKKEFDNLNDAYAYYKTLQIEKAE
ncbi:type II secretion system protein [Blautia sp. Sow4_E7]|uniref:type II secretion system protein n=1 Tax=Blautia sp. Sow4_E7 TaxID=3438749 RepID=UPI003F9375C6